MTFPPDGYKIFLNNEMIDKLHYTQKLYDEQIKLLDNIDNVVNEMEKIPPLSAGGLEKWIDSLEDIDNKNPFRLKDYSNLFKLNKEYNKLKEKRDVNITKIKIAVIDNLLERIKNLL
jgi:hypothetical protein